MTWQRITVRIPLLVATVASVMIRFRLLWRHRGVPRMRTAMALIRQLDGTLRHMPSAAAASGGGEGSTFSPIFTEN